MWLRVDYWQVLKKKSNATGVKLSVFLATEKMLASREGFCFVEICQVQVTVWI
jgi:hypothetical protein